MIEVYTHIQKSITGKCYQNYSLAPRTTIQAGGPADIFVEPTSIEDLRIVTNIAKQHKIPITVIGKGSNLLIADEGVSGIVIQLCAGEFVNIKRLPENRIEAGCGVLKSALLDFAIHESLSGLEFSMGIPGDLGGGMQMNAGTKYGCYAERVIAVTLFDPKSGETEVISNPREQSSYREQTYIGSKIVIRVLLQLEHGNQEQMKRETARIMAERASKQPLEWPNFGSAFKNPNHTLSAGRMIEQCGLKGLTIGGAQVSKKHANFIINRNQATATDIMRLLCKVQQTVYNRFSIWLEPEVRLIGNFAHRPPVTLRDFNPVTSSPTKDRLLPI